ncbi:(2,3-dihydroxybenzoyl)adenylate synthase [Thaumasiovibrio subtropicus]|uniref:(2,3-dihydroxybenzoyl)adenylate synthase n=1 Tax=Thaumasiovibrio subtropicus TaxID=1891207 RepID=UPI000B3604BD|nr:AMP-binding protein [Thaumasiovibrio subtropicus]
MPVNYTPWPLEDARAYKQRGLWIDKPLSDILDRQIQVAPDQIAIVTETETITYRTLDRYVNCLVRRLIALGIKSGDTALVQLPNDYPFYVVFFALQRLGVVPVNALFNHNREELRHYAAQIQPALVIGALEQPLFQDDSLITDLRTTLGKSLVCLIDDECRVGETSYKAFAQPLRCWLSADQMISGIDLDINADNVAFFQLSGGSTGTPKLITRTHNDYYYSIRQSVAVCEWDSQTRYLCALPAAHNFSLSSPGALGVFYAGGTLVIARDPSAATCFPLIKAHEVTWTALVPPAAILWLNSHEDKADLQTLRYLQVGGAKLSATVAKALEQQMDITLQQVFGMAEGLVNYTRLDDDEWTRHHTQGRPMSDDDIVRVVDEYNCPVPCGEEGLLTTKGPYTFRGYYQAESHNQKSFTDAGFYRSGDRVVQTASGHLMVVGRDKDQINKGGEKIAAEEIENYLLAHSDVHDAAVVAMPDPYLGERICAFVVTKPTKALKANQLNAFIRTKQLADFKYPDRYEFIDTLPKTNVGKVDKKALRTHIAEKIAARMPATTA